MRRTSLPVGVVAVWVAGTAGIGYGIELLTFDDPASLRSWSFGDGPEFPGARGRLTWEAEQGRSAPGCLALHYSFVDGGNYVRAALSPTPDQADAREIRLWLRKPGEHRITFRLVDAAGQTFQKSVEYTYDGWQQVAVDLAHWTHSFGGPGDGTVRFPMREFSILIENTGLAREGVLHIDDVQFFREAGGAGAAMPGTYVATDFRGSPGWHAGGGEGNTWRDGQWRYRFGEGDRPPVLATDFSLLGRPQRLRLVVDSDGSGHGVRVHLGSHFQTFHREIGRLTGHGEQVLDVELGAMTGWDHYGGQDDGQARMPLRMRRIELHRADGSAEGTIRPRRIEVDTVFEDGGGALLIPDAVQIEDQAAFSVSVQNLHPTASRGRLVCDIRALGRLLERHVEELTLPPAGQERKTRRFTAAIGDHHFLEAEFHWIGEAGRPRPVSIGIGTVPSDPGSAEPEAASPMGMGLYLNRWHADHRAPEMLERIADLARRAGVRWSREEFGWSIIEPRQGEFNWEFYDRLVDVTERNGISICALLCYWSPYADAYTPEGIEQYCAWVRQVVRRYRGRIRHWQIWNEPNIFFWSGPKELYAELLARAYETIRAEDPDAVVVGCSTSGIDIDFIRDTMRRGGRFDVLSVHPYRGILRDLPYMDELRDVRGLVDDRPVWITEIGFPSQLHGGYSERRQAGLLARTYLSSIASGAVDKVFWYNFRNDGADPFYHEMNFGLVRSDLRPKPAYRAMATLARTLAGLRLVDVMNLEDDAYAARFRGAGRDVVAVCSPSTGRLFSFETDAEVAVVNGVGEPVEPIRDGRRHTLTLDAGFPVYIIGLGEFARIDPPSRVALSATSVRPGGRVTIEVSPAADVASWDLPYGWPDPERQREGEYRLIVPPDAPAGHVDIQLILATPGGERIPLLLHVQPALIQS